MPPSRRSRRSSACSTTRPHWVLSAAARAPPLPAHMASFQIFSPAAGRCVKKVSRKLGIQEQIGITSRASAYLLLSVTMETRQNMKKNPIRLSNHIWAGSSWASLSAFFFVLIRIWIWASRWLHSCSCTHAAVPGRKEDATHMRTVPRRRPPASETQNNSGVRLGKMMNMICGPILSARVAIL